MNVAHRLVIAFFVLVLLSLGCSDGALRLRHADPPRRAPPVRVAGAHDTDNARAYHSDNDTPRSLRVATFNAGLAVGVLPHSIARAPRIAEALGALDVDVMCVQELWLDEHWQRLVAATRLRLPQALRAQIEPSTSELPCTPSEIAPIDACVRRSCGVDGVVAGSEQTAACAVKSCAHLGRQVSRACLRCLTQDPLRGLDDIEAACVGSDAARRESAAARSALAKSSALGTSYGIGLLTRARVLERELLALEAEHHPRGVLYARLATAALGEVHVFCTHLTPVHGHMPHPSGGSWKQHQSRQIDQLLAFVDRKAPQGALALVLGDLNTGPNRYAAHYRRFEQRGFRSPYLEADAPLCTYCAQNPVAGGAGPGGSIIDHVLVRGEAAVVRSQRIFDEPVVIEAAGRRVTTALSDHYGVLAELAAEP